MSTTRYLLALPALALLVGTAWAEPASTTTLPLHIEAQPLDAALNQWAEQTGYSVLVPYDRGARGQLSPSVEGRYTAESALKILLASTDLQYTFVGERIVSIGASGRERQPLRLAEQTERSADPAPATSSINDAVDSSGSAPTAQAPQTSQGMPEILIEGSKILNMDIKRSRDDIQPYVVFDRSTIERSGATDVNDFLKSRLPMNIVGQSPNQNGRNTSNGNNSRINLRGLGDNQTLVLIDGHRTTSNGNTSGPGQADINGIPTGAIERIEVLPTTASGIYGGSATGGVVNVVLRRDYQGIELGLTYGDTTKRDAATRQVTLSGGTTLEDGRTSVLFSGSYSDTDDLFMGDRDLIARGRATALANNPAFFSSSTTPILGSTTNIRSANGSNLTLKPAFGGGSLNSPITYVPIGYTGVSSDAAAALRANAGSYNLALADSTQNSGLSAGARASLLSAPTVKSALFTVRRRFSSQVDAFIDLMTASDNGSFGYAPSTLTFSNIPVNAATNPFNQPITVTVPITSLQGVSETENSTRSAITGVIVRLPHNWITEADLTWGRARFFNSNPDSLLTAATTAVNASGAAGLNVLRDPSLYSDAFLQYVPDPATSGPFISKQINGAWRASGPVASLPAGDVILSALAEYRREQQEAGFTTTPRNGTTNYYPEREQTIRSAYLEAKVPVVSAKQNIPGIRALELQIAGRIDDYSLDGVTSNVEVGSTTPIVRRGNDHSSINPTFGLRWLPINDLTLRASYGTGFLPPTVQQLVPSSSSTANYSTTTDPLRGNSIVGTVQATSGGNPNLNPEKSESWSAGLVFAPGEVSGLRLSVDYTHIRKTDNITGLTVPLVQIALDQGLYSERFTRAPLTPGDPYSVGKIIAIDTTSLNISRAAVGAYDLAVDYAHDFGTWGDWSFFASGTKLTEYMTQLQASLPEVDSVGVDTNAASIPVKFKGTGGVTWHKGDLTLGWNTTYLHSYLVADPSVVANARIIDAQGNGGRVPSQTFHDFMARYRLTQRLPEFLASTLDELSIQGGVRNVFDKEPAFDALNQMAFYSYLADPRGRSFYLSIKSQW